jgi:hypothetical protein
MERRRTPAIDQNKSLETSWDENFIVCISHPITGKGETIIFDWFAKRTAGESYSSFAADYPFFEHRGGWYTANDCSLPKKTKSRNILYLQELVNGYKKRE